MEQVLPEDAVTLRWEEDPILEAVALGGAGYTGEAESLLGDLLTADLRCLDAHAHLGNLELRRRWPDSLERAARHFRAGLEIADLTLGSGFQDVLPWGLIDNRPYLRCLHGYGLALWQRGETAAAAQVFRRMLWLNPDDNQGACSLIGPVEKGVSWETFDEQDGEGETPGHLDDSIGAAPRPPTPRSSTSAKIVKQPPVVADPTIDEVLDQFLEEQRRRLAPRTFRNYEDVVNLLRDCLNGYAYQWLSKKEAALFDRHYNAEGDAHREFCQLFGPEKILGELDHFLGTFMIRKVAAGEDFLRAAGTAVGKLAEWLMASDHVAEDRGREVAEDVAGDDTGASSCRACSAAARRRCFPAPHRPRQPGRRRLPRLRSLHYRQDRIREHLARGLGARQGRIDGRSDSGPRRQQRSCCARAGM